MPMKLDSVGVDIDGPAFSWTPDDVMLYGVAVGSENISLTTENSRGVSLQTLPLFAVILSARAAGETLQRAGDFEMSQVLHIAQKVDLAGPLPVSGSAIGSRRVDSITDTGKHAVVEMTTSLRDAVSGAPYAQVTTTTLIRGEGGFGGDAPIRRSAEIATDSVQRVCYQTTPQQALLYRLTGDRNPLHSDPSFAALAGFDRPILHGLATLGIVARQLHEAVGVDRTVTQVCGAFRSPVYPGDLLATEFTRDGDTVTFRSSVAENPVLENASITFAPASVDL